MLAVVPYVGTWIEMDYYSLLEREEQVVPYVGTWIEMHLPVQMM